jgi:hypothetical protein
MKEAVKRCCDDRHHAGDDEYRVGDHAEPEQCIDDGLLVELP